MRAFVATAALPHSPGTASRHAGEGIMGSLRSQKGILENAQNSLKDTDDDLFQGGRLLKSMTQRAAMNRKIASAILVCVVIVLIWLLFGRV